MLHIAITTTGWAGNYNNNAHLNKGPKCLPIDHKHLPVVIHRRLIVALQLSGRNGQQTVIVDQMKDEP
ncbi:hypothetical protein T08_5100 [Trichinella sp. T8]|nr:hypothetical protein T08_5100 [Trichinella sp. T8]